VGRAAPITEFTVDPMIRQIVDRLHVGTSNLDVCRHVRSRMQSKVRRGLRCREFRKWAYRQALKRHRENQDEYAWVMSGH